MTHRLASKAAKNIHGDSFLLFLPFFFSILCQHHTKLSEANFSPIRPPCAAMRRFIAVVTAAAVTATATAVSVTLHTAPLCKVYQTSDDMFLSFISSFFSSALRACLSVCSLSAILYVFFFFFIFFLLHLFYFLCRLSAVDALLLLT